MSSSDDDAGQVADSQQPTSPPPGQPYASAYPQAFPQPMPPSGQAYPPMGPPWPSGAYWPPGSYSGGLGPIGRPLDRPPAARYFRPVQSLSNASIALICLNVLLTMAVVAADWNSYLVRDDLGDASVSDADLSGAYLVAFALLLLMSGSLLVAGVVFICWLWRARLNAELLCPAEHRRSRGWIIGSWFCPIVNLWFPKQIVDDVWRASDPGNPVLTPTFREGAPPKSGLVHLWWWPWLIVSVINNGFPPGGADAEPTVESLRSTAIAGTVGLLFSLISAVAIVLIIRRIGAWQTQRQYAWPYPNYAAPMQ